MVSAPNERAAYDAWLDLLSEALTHCACTKFMESYQHVHSVHGRDVPAAASSRSIERPKRHGEGLLGLRQKTNS